MAVTSDQPSLFIDPVSNIGAALTSWGEISRPRLTRAQTGGRLAILDYRAPAGFGPARHVHHDDDEIFLIEQGTIALWTPSACRTARPGELVLLPRAIPHTWRAFGPDPVRLQVIVAPGWLEDFFPPLAERRLTLSDQAEIAEIATQAGAEFLGPPLSDEDVATITSGGQPGEFGSS